LHTQKERNDPLLKNLKFCYRYRSENNFAGILKITNNAIQKILILATGLNVLHYFDSTIKLLFWSVFN